ncbi:MAG: tetratricopeptide repeat protein, partial [Polyangiales bacterium]
MASRQCAGQHVFARRFACSMALAVVWVVAACGGGAAVQRPVAVAPAADPRAAALYLEAVQQMAAADAESQARAVTGFEAALRADPALWEAQYNLGVLLWRRGELKKALPHLERAHELADGEREPLVALAEAQHALGRRAEAARLLAEYVEAHPDAVDVRIALAAVLRERGAYDEALASVRQALVRDPASLPALLEVGRIYRVKGDLDVAEVVFEKALALDAKSASTHNDLGLLALARGDTQRAFDEFEKATASDARFVPARLNRASVLLRAGDYAAAQREYRAVLEVA